MRLQLCVPLAVLLSVSAVSAMAAPPAIYNLGTLGGTSSSGAAVNNAGQVTGTSRTTGDAASHAFRYDGMPGSGGVMRDLGTLGGTNSFGNAINASGQVAGHSNIAGGGQHAFRYTGAPGSGGVMQDLEVGINSIGGSFTYGINDSGQVAGRITDAGDLRWYAARYTGTPGSGGFVDDLGTLGGYFVDAYGINASGQVVGWSQREDNGLLHAFLYTGTPGSGGTMFDLDGYFLNPLMIASSSSATAINDRGQIVGQWEDLFGFDRHAFLYTGTPGIDGMAYDLGTLGGKHSGATAINANGQVVGSSNPAPGSFDDRAFLYTGTPGIDGVMTNLDAWLDAANPAEGAKWTLQFANGLNDFGLITGTGYYDDGPGGQNDGQRAFLLDASSLLPVPEPSGLALLILSVPAFLFLRPLRAQEGVSDCLPSANSAEQPPRLVTTLEGRCASSGLPDPEPLRWQDAQAALSAGMDRTTEQSPAALETNDADDTRIDRNKVPPLGQSSTTDPRRIRHNAPQMVAVGRRCSAAKAWQERDSRVPRLGPQRCRSSPGAESRPHLE